MNVEPKVNNGHAPWKKPYVQSTSFVMNGDWFKLGSI